MWSDDLTVTLVGWGKPLLPLNPHRLNHLDTVAEANRLLQAWLALRPSTPWPATAAATL